MKKIIALTLLVSCTWLFISAQQDAAYSINGIVKDQSTGEVISNVTIRIKNADKSSVSDSTGNFILRTLKLPVTLIISHAGFNTREITVVNNSPLTISIEPSVMLIEGVFLSSKGIPTRILDAAFSAELIGQKMIRQLPTTSVYDATAYIKGIDLTSSSLTFKTPSTRGFNGSGSSRVNQIVDGMDNQAPGLNFFVGSFAGPTDLDIESIELLPGASSALYGPGGMNGTILINSKNPFKYDGLSVQIKQGIMHVDKSQRANASPYFDYSLRWAKSFNQKFAFKIGAQYISAKDWLANDSTNYLRNGTSGKLISGTRASDPNYDGVNVYGDETSIDVRQFIGAIAGFYPPGSTQQNAILQLYNSMQHPTLVSRTGYQEIDIIDPETKNIKLSGALHYKLSNSIEASLMGNWSTGNTVYTDDNRYALKDIKVSQYKLELKHKNWFFRTYTTQEDAGEAFSATVATQLFNETWKPSYDPTNPMGSWYLQYAGAFIDATFGGADNSTAHNIARSYADQGRPDAGTTQFKELFDRVRKTPIPKGGLFKEKSQLWMTEGQYTLGDAKKNAEVIIGASYKNYILNSSGTIFIDTAKAIDINEIGSYVQITKKLFNENLTLTTSGRFDKNENFKGQFTPRAAALIKLAKDNNLRVSYQTSYRFAGNLAQWIRLNVGGNFILLGGLPWVIDYMNAGKDPVYQVNENGIPSSSPYQFTEFKPETMNSFEFGYKGLIKNKLLIDAYAYFGKYESFLGRIGLYQPGTGSAYSIVVNSSTKVKTHGYGLGFDYRLNKNYSLFSNLYSDMITNVPAGFKSYFNTPKYRINAGFANSGLGKKEKIAFNIMMHWQDAFSWEGELANGPLPAFSTIDAQVSYKMPSIKSAIRLGGTNIFNKYYKNAYANPTIGAVYYVGFIYNL